VYCTHMLVAFPATGVLFTTSSFLYSPGRKGHAVYGFVHAAIKYSSAAVLALMHGISVLYLPLRQLQLSDGAAYYLLLFFVIYYYNV
jgi:hypothetical protein